MAAATSQRPWDLGNPASAQNVTPKGQLPSIAALVEVPGGSSGLPSPASTRERDSGAWSQRSSAYSTNTSSYTFPSNTNSYYMSPNRASALSASSHLGTTSHPSGDYSIPPTSSSALGSPGYATSGSLLPSINKSHEPHRQSQGDFPPQESRRSSIGSQVNQGMGSLQLNGNGTNSPYPGSSSVNHSQTSLAQNLSRERGISGPHALRSSRSNAQIMSPLSPTSEARPPFSRVAPPIGRNPDSMTAHAQQPVPGQAYAFPDAPDLEPGALPPKSASRHNVNSLTNLNEEREASVYSRRDSGHQSIASSIVTSDSHLPPGQRRLEDSKSIGMHHMHSYHGSRADSEASDSMLGTHHHSLQQGQMSKLTEDEALTPEEGAQPYSRTPALRVSHKMAERKRRSEMKDLFENLRSQIPSNQGSKSSKWEILTKASDYIKQLENVAHSGGVAEKQLRLACHDLDVTRREIETMRSEHQQMMQEIQLLRQQQQSAPPAQHAPPPPQHQQHQQQQQNSVYGAPPQHYVPPPPPPPPSAPMQDPARSLPPLTNANNNSSSMQGIQYHER